MTDETYTSLRSQSATLDRTGTSWPALIEKIQADDATGMKELYDIFSRGVRLFLWRQLGREDLEDAVHDAFLTVAQAIRRGEVREPERLMGYLWTIVRRQLATRVGCSIEMRKRRGGIEGMSGLLDRNADPEWAAIVRQRQRIARSLLGEVNERDRDILVRFYLLEQTPAEICREMGLTETQFRLLKSRAKARFGALGRRRLSHQKICW